jgi:hypothetical protein
LGYITSAKIGDGSWHGTDENFILNWQEQIRLYEWLTPTSGHISDEQKLTMLQTAVHPLQELRQVKANAALLKVHTKQGLDYEAYPSLLCPLEFRTGTRISGFLLTRTLSNRKKVSLSINFFRSFFRT